MESSELQRALIERIRTQLPSKKNLAVELEKILHISQSAIYKRLQGKIPFTFDDLAKLIQHFDLPLSQIANPNAGIIQGTFSGLYAGASCLDYLKSIEREMSAIQNSRSPQLWLMGSELPDFYWFYFDELALLQYYIWERMVWNVPDWQERRFSFKLPKKKAFLASGKRILQHYHRIPAMEFWNYQVLDTALSQMEYLLESKLFEQPKDAICLCGQMCLLVRHMSKMLENGSHFFPGGQPKPDAASFHLFCYEALPANKTVLVETAEGNTLYASLTKPHFIKIKNPVLGNYLKKKFQTLFQRAESLNRIGEKGKNRFFKALESRVGRLERIISKLLKVGVAPPPL